MEIAGNLFFSVTTAILFWFLIFPKSFGKHLGEVISAASPHKEVEDEQQ